MKKQTRETRAGTITSMKKLTDKAINEHPLLDREQGKLCRAFIEISKSKGESFTMLDFAQVALRATARDYAAASEKDDTTEMVIADHALKLAAILYVREALLRCEASIVSEYPELDNAVDLLTWLSRELS